MKKSKTKIKSYDTCFQTHQMMIAENYGAQRDPLCPALMAEKLDLFRQRTEEAKVA